MLWFDNTDHIELPAGWLDLILPQYIEAMIKNE